LDEKTGESREAGKGREELSVSWRGVAWRWTWIRCDYGVQPYPRTLAPSHRRVKRGASENLERDPSLGHNVAPSPLQSTGSRVARARPEFAESRVKEVVGGKTVSRSSDVGRSHCCCCCWSFPLSLSLSFSLWFNPDTPHFGPNPNSLETKSQRRGLAFVKPPGPEPREAAGL
jgi:hypothetical protein